MWRFSFAYWYGDTKKLYIDHSAWCSHRDKNQEGDNIRANTFFQVAIYVCLALIVFNFAYSFIVSLSVFPVGPEGVPGSTQASVFRALTGLNTGVADLWLIIVSAGAIATGFISWLIRSPAPIGVYIFSVVFWNSYNAALNALPLEMLPAEFVIIGTVAMLFLYSAASIGLLTGGG